MKQRVANEAGTTKRRIHKKPPISQLRSDFWESAASALLNRATIAAGLGVSLAWLEQRATVGTFVPYFKFGRRALYRKRDVMEWLTEHGKFHKSTRDANPVQFELDLGGGR